MSSGSSQASKIKPNCPGTRPEDRRLSGRATPGHPDPFRTIALKAIQATSKGEREAKKIYIERKQKTRQRTSFEQRNFGNISNATFGRVSNNFGLGFCC